LAEEDAKNQLAVLRQQLHSWDDTIHKQKRKLDELEANAKRSADNAASKAAVQVEADRKVAELKRQLEQALADQKAAKQPSPRSSRMPGLSGSD